MQTHKDDDNFGFDYVVKNGKLMNLEFSMDISRSQNMIWAGCDSTMKRTVEVGPQASCKLGRVERQSANLAARLQTSLSWKLMPLDSEHANPLREQFQTEMADRAATMMKYGISVDELQTAEAIRQACCAANESFVDTAFLPGDRCLYADPGHRSDRPFVVWRRPKEFLKEVVMFKDDISPCDIKQGALGDCWFLSALAAIAEVPDRIRALFATTEANDEGVYEVVCWKNGVRTTIVVDDWFPCNPSTGEPCYSHTHGDELWVIILEKAWAKLHGSYEAIEGGIPMEALMDLLGEPGQVLVFEEHQDEINSGGFRLAQKQFYDLGYVVTAGTPGKDDQTKAEDRQGQGIIPGHAYTVLGLKDVKENHLVELRNPWGETEWNGPWSDTSGMWDDEAKAQAGYSPEINDGSFWMSDTGFIRYYSEVNVVFSHGFRGVRQGWCRHRQEIDLGGGDGFFIAAIEVDIAKESHGFITLWQPDARVPNTPEYAKLCFGMYGPIGGNSSREVLKSPAFWHQRQLVQKAETLSPGTYVILVWNLDEGARTTELGRKAMVMLTFAPLDDTHDCGLVARTQEPTRELAELGVRATLQEAEEGGTGNDVVIRSGWLAHGGFGMLASCASSSASAFSLEVNFSGSLGLQLVGESDEDNAALVARRHLEPDGAAAIVELRPTARSRSANYGYSWKGVQA
eukprot:TRINITY_DN16748_c0_g1_i1.p1 TRINITY_DN16748_c0_g1~~TRINITY_DN16748_c0_g1_i1.p1  ORF type:complete len:686 (+),score=79.47 TRINITY_DN16748_c0_g1_i1:281-2338(+)